MALITKALLVVIMGCAHVGYSGITPTRFQGLFNDILDRNPHEIFFIGSMIHDEENFSSYYEVVKNYPVLNIPSERIRTTPDLKIPPFVRYVGNDSFIFLDSEWKGLPKEQVEAFDRVPHNPEQIEFLKEALSKEGRKFLLVHYAAWLDPDAKSIWYNDIHPLIKGKVDAVFGACYHFHIEEDVDGVKYITVGAAGKHGFGYRLLKIDKDSFTTELVLE